MSSYTITREGRRKPQPIAGVEPGAVSDLRAALFTAQSQLRSSSQRGPRTKLLPLPATSGVTPAIAASHALFSRSNDGVAARAARDSAAHELATNESKQFDESYARMAAKARVYEKLASGAAGQEGRQGTFLVNFQRKGEEGGRAETQLDSLEGQQTELITTTTTETATTSPITHDEYPVHTGIPPRIAEWEQQALNEVKSAMMTPTDPSQNASAGAEAGSGAVADATMSSRQKHAYELRRRRERMEDKRRRIEEKNERKRMCLLAHRPHSLNQQPHTQTGTATTSASIG